VDERAALDSYVDRLPSLRANGVIGVLTIDGVPTEVVFEESLGTLTITPMNDDGARMIGGKKDEPMTGPARSWVRLRALNAEGLRRHEFVAWLLFPDGASEVSRDMCFTTYQEVANFWFSGLHPVSVVVSIDGNPHAFRVAGRT
jgi:hypothetical protein